MNCESALQDIKKQQQILDELRRSLDALKTKETDLNSHFSYASQIHKEFESKISEQRTVLDAAIAKTETQRKELAQQISVFNSLLGLKLQPLESGVRITFVNIDPVNPYREFKFVISQLDATYSVDDCHPSVDYYPLVDLLNRDNNFNKFLIGCRNLFRESAIGHF